MSTPATLAHPPRQGALPSQGPASPPEWELKLRLPLALAPTARGLLDAVCRRDPQYPANYVSSLYYDSPEFESLHEKLSSDLAKAKVRLRWYESVSRGVSLPGVFLEVKYRKGAWRSKRRIQVPLDSGWLAEASVDDVRLRRLPSRFASELSAPGLSRLKPTVVVRYRRHRWLEPSSGSRISLDSGISAPRAECRLAPMAMPLRTAVVEVKNRTGQIPATLAPLWSLGARLDSFSKYGACCLAACLGGQPEP